MWFWWIWSLVWDLPACSDISANLGERNLEKIRHFILESSFPRTLQSCSKCDALWKDQSVVSIQCLKCGNRKICVASAQVRCSSFPSAEEKKRLFQCYQRFVVMLAGFFSRQKCSNIMAWDSFLVSRCKAFLFPRTSFDRFDWNLSERLWYRLWEKLSRRFLNFDVFDSYERGKNVFILHPFKEPVYDFVRCQGAFHFYLQTCSVKICTGMWYKIWHAKLSW